jgi:hypothetical protein
MGVKPEVRVSRSLQFVRVRTIDSRHKPRRRETICPRDAAAPRPANDYPVFAKANTGGASNRGGAKWRGRGGGMRAGLSSAVTGLAARSVELSPRSIAGCECAAWRLESRRIRERCRRGTPRGGGLVERTSRTRSACAFWSRSLFGCMGRVDRPEFSTACPRRAPNVVGTAFWHSRSGTCFTLSGG